MILLSGLGYDKLWEIIKGYKTKYLIENIKNVKRNHLCFVDDDEESVLYWNWNMMDLAIESLEKELIKSGSKHNDFDDYKNYDHSNVITSDLYEAAGEMFIYLMLCPKFMHHWKTLYIDLIQNASPVIIMQTLNRILITGRHRKDRTSVDISKTIIRKTANKLSLNFQAVAKFYKRVPMFTMENIEHSNLSINILPKVYDTKENLGNALNELNVNGKSVHYLICLLT